jgi:hypothetical protein
MTSNGRRTPIEDDLQWKTTSNGRQLLMEDNSQNQSLEAVIIKMVKICPIIIFYFLFPYLLEISQQTSTQVHQYVILYTQAIYYLKLNDLIRYSTILG